MRRLTVKVIPKSSSSEVISCEDDQLKVRLNAVPEKGEANEKLIEVLAAYFKIPKSKISIIRGHKSRTKIVQLETS